MDRDEQNPMDGMFEDKQNEDSVEITEETEIAAEDISTAESDVGESFIDKDLSEAPMVGERDPMQSYEQPKKSKALPVTLLFLVIIGVGYVFAGDQIISLMSPEPEIVNLKKQNPITPTAVNNPVQEELSDGSFTSTETVEEPIQMAQPPVVDDASVQEVAKEELTDEPVMDKKQELVEALTSGNTDNMPNEILAAPKPIEEQSKEMDKQDLIAQILAESVADLDADEPSRTITGDRMPDIDPELYDEAAANQASNIIKSNSGGPSAADLVRESVIVRPRIKKLVIVEKNFASSSDRSLAEAAQRSLNNRQYGAAYDFYGDILATDPTNEIAMMGKAKSLVLMSRNDEALQVYSAILERNPSNHEAMTNYFGLVGDIDPITASLELEQLAKINPKSAEIQGQLGVVYGKMKDPIRAMRSFDKASSLDPDNALYPYNSAVLADRMMNKSKAINYYDKALTLLKTSGVKSSLSKGDIEKRLNKLYSQQ